MKTLRISDDVHGKLTATVGTLMAQTGKMQTYQDAIEAMLNQSPNFTFLYARFYPISQMVFHMFFQ